MRWFGDEAVADMVELQSREGWGWAGESGSGLEADAEEVPSSWEEKAAAANWE